MPNKPPDPPFGQLGRLACDPSEDRILCHFCGGWYRQLAQHARLTHGLTADAYREMAGLNRTTPLVSPGIQAHMREVGAPILAQARADGTTPTWDKHPELLQAAKAAAAETRRKGLRPEGSRHRKESWDEDRRRERAEQMRERNLAGKMQTTTEARSQAMKRYLAEHTEAIDRARSQITQLHQQEIDGHTARDVICPRCGQSFRAPSHRDKYCPPCRPFMANEYSAASWRRRKQKESRKAEEGEPAG